MEDIGAFLRKLRGKMSLRDAAERSGLSHSYISALEQNKRPGTNTPIRPSPDALRSLAKAYNYPYEELMRAAGYIEEDKEKAAEGLSQAATEAILKEYIEKYNIDLTIPGQRQRLEDILRLIYDGSKS